MSSGKLEKQKQNLVEAGLMEASDELIDFLQASYVEPRLGKLGKWKQGWAYFTEQKLIVLTGLLNDNMIIPYKKIQKLEKCSQSLLPIGIVITYEDETTSKVMTAKISMMKREKWLSFITEKSGVAVG